ncbi:unnamed protein product [Amoebophrya sp. A120]|nr:unnamed protein product [Amoebophrya sp. A120]|eukprot:GSA120T00008302001.1
MNKINVSNSCYFIGSRNNYSQAENLNRIFHLFFRTKTDKTTTRALLARSANWNNSFMRMQIASTKIKTKKIPRIGIRSCSYYLLGMVPVLSEFYFSSQTSHQRSS